MEYILNTFNIDYNNIEDENLLIFLCNYYDGLLKYLNIMLKTKNPTVFYKAMNEAYTRVDNHGDLVNFISSKLVVDIRQIETPIKRYNDGQLTNPYCEVWDVINLQGRSILGVRNPLKKSYNQKELEDLVNNKKIVVLDTSKQKYIKNEYVNTIGNNVYYNGLKIDSEKLEHSYLTKKPKFNKDSYYYLENYHNVVNVIREDFFCEKRLINDINYISNIQTELYKKLKNNYKTLKK